MIGLFIVREEGGLFEPVGPAAWLTSDAPIWGVRIGRLRLIYDTILKRLGYVPWRYCWWSAADQGRFERSIWGRSTPTSAKSSAANPHSD